MIKREMRPANWITAFFGALLIILGYYLVSPITRDYETPRAFFAILTLNIGLLTVIIGLSLNFERWQKPSPQKAVQEPAPEPKAESPQKGKSQKRRRG